MRKAILLAALLVVGAVAAPAASAHHIMQCSPGSPNACQTVSVAVNNTGHTVLCMVFEEPVANWVTCL